MNEPWCSAFLGYGSGVHAPGRLGDRNAKQAGHHLLLGHGLAMQALRINVPDGKLGIVLNMGPASPLSKRYDDKIAAKIVEANGNNWFLEPLVEGQYPEIINLLKPEEQPLILEGDMQLMSAPMDFIGINYYTRVICSYDKDSLIKMCKNDHAEHTNFGWSMLDNFEWTGGYTKRFGLYHVYFETQQRTPKTSAKAFKEFLSRRKDSLTQANKTPNLKER